MVNENAELPYVFRFFSRNFPPVKSVKLLPPPWLYKGGNGNEYQIPHSFPPTPKMERKKKKKQQERNFPLQAHQTVTTKRIQKHFSLVSLNTSAPLNFH